MALLMLGILVFIVGLLMTRNPEMNHLLQTHDDATWRKVMNPTTNGYVNSFGLIPLYAWIVARGYESSASIEVQTLGRKIIGRAYVAKFLMLIGVALLFAGFYIALLLR